VDPGPDTKEEGKENAKKKVNLQLVSSAEAVFGHQKPF
jgi:hypothetical protein